ncbi:hypothetical protein TNCV_1606721 [Trichonephila clavipes]|nr:hypothetical protein TNCV_1606721 [Trichonephila clavipes]
MHSIRLDTLSSKIQKEMSLFANGLRRGDYPERTYSYLMTTKHTRVDSERAFSSDFPEVINSIVVVKIPNPTDISLVWVPF